jgi:tRNA pseudouridine38-40 synthase
MIRRVALKIEYDGAGFWGFQRQADGVSVQSVLEQAASRLNNGAPVACTAAGRTDSGVHATGQVVHMDLPAHYTPAAIRNALNYHAKPHRVAVLEVVEVPANWSARFSAIGRAYCYTINTRQARLVLDAGRAWHVSRPLDIAAMQAAARELVGRHDFTSFRASSCQANSPIRTLETLDILQDGPRILIIAEARSFLHHQVRNMVGTLKLVGDNKMRPEWVARVIAAKDRAAAGPTAPADGLVMTRVDYDPDPFLRHSAGA